MRYKMCDQKLLLVFVLLMGLFMERVTFAESALNVDVHCRKETQELPDSNGKQECDFVCRADDNPIQAVCTARSHGGACTSTESDGKSIPSVCLIRPMIDPKDGHHYNHIDCYNKDGVDCREDTED